MLVCVCLCVCRTPGESVRDFKALAASPIDERAVPMFIVTCFSTRGASGKKKHQGMAALMDKKKGGRENSLR